MSPHFENTRFAAIAGLTEKLSEITQYVTEWEGRKISKEEGGLPKQIGRLILNNLNLLTHPKDDKPRIAFFTQAFKLSGALGAAQERTQGVDKLITMLDHSISRFAPIRKFEERLPLEILLKILTCLPAAKDELVEVRPRVFSYGNFIDSIQTFRSWRLIEPELTRRALAEWVSQYQIPLHKLDMSYEEAFELAPWLRYLDLTSCGFEEKLSHELVANCHKLTYLIYPNKLSQLPDLPKNLEVLDCSYSDQLTTLPELPLSLKALICYKCEKLQKLPVLPQGLETLDLTKCYLIERIPDLPESLKELIIASTKLLELPELRSCLETLDCSDSVLMRLPKLPGTLKTLSCIKCENLSELPDLPSSLKKLVIIACYQLNRLPCLPPNLTMLTCSLTTIQNLHPLPGTLLVLNCVGNPLSKLPDYLPASLEHLDCSGCGNLTVIPVLPAGLKWFRFSSCPKLLAIPMIPPGCRVES